MAQDIDLTQVIYTLEVDEGGPIPLKDEKDNPFVLGKAIRGALLSNEAAKGKDGLEKVAYFDIAMKAIADHASFSADEIVTIKKAVAVVYGPIIVGRVYHMIDPEVDSGDNS